MVNSYNIINPYIYMANKPRKEASVRYSVASETSERRSEA